MCRSIQRLRTPDGPASKDDIEAAALQFVRKISGFRTPPSAAPEAFTEAVRTITEASRQLLGELPALRVRPDSTPPPA
jgi:hypothetical protein